ncbi:hypothetical protein BCR34DRAFT_364314 [Clohesyomyces aquaticus]|uniref:Uncharacterized protein n=1 Tax=Clohesyomyces aquaticus TaxID=1231657 RepID=A0A1Y1ZHV1_9PLEO|nr:hypothetical protein BCR34DRAFT_364314 [Clohesyomyces aquaticus]
MRPRDLAHDKDNHLTSALRNLAIGGTYQIISGNRARGRLIYRTHSSIVACQDSHLWVESLVRLVRLHSLGPWYSIDSQRLFVSQQSEFRSPRTVLAMSGSPPISPAVLPAAQPTTEYPISAAHISLINCPALRPRAHPPLKNSLLSSIHPLVQSNPRAQQDLSSRRDEITHNAILSRLHPRSRPLKPLRRPLHPQPNPLLQRQLLQIQHRQYALQRQLAVSVSVSVSVSSPIRILLHLNPCRRRRHPTSTATLSPPPQSLARRLPPLSRNMGPESPRNYERVPCRGVGS